MTRFNLFIASALLLAACNGDKAKQQTPTGSQAIPVSPNPKPQIHTDTLQFIHFEGNFDYWSCIFLNSSKDTVTLVTDSMINEKFKNRLFEVKWFKDTLVQAGDNDSKFAANRMSHFRPIKGKPFVAPITEEKILQDIRDLPEVQSGADQVVIAERPADGKNYYLVETGTHGEDNFSRLCMFRVYTYPIYKITVLVAAENTELSLEQWRNLNH
ncbi:hypothetical protein [Pedobacter psychroterrae]|uniref:Uncharacterized protein n=1 Tax=Pedobacter psychroterrae TaxID=2530453 RepID=A0A4V2MLB9_9SPHI|nr:hypothetical protein [Pedobacter psychroterrae]TCD01397.1 hypothetical protein EZ437_11670 [Pedobacter psychroterrae]